MSAPLWSAHSADWHAALLPQRVLAPADSMDLDAGDAGPALSGHQSGIGNSAVASGTPGAASAAAPEVVSGEEHRLTGHSQAVLCLAMAPGRLLLSGSADCTIKVSMNCYSRLGNQLLSRGRWLHLSVHAMALLPAAPAAFLGTGGHSAA